MKRLLLIITILLIAVFTASCTNNTPITDAPSTSTNSPDTDKKEDMAMKFQMKDLTEKNYICITELFYFGNLPYADIEMLDNTAVAKVNSNNYKSLDDIRNFLSSIYAQDEVERLLNDYFDDRPLYFEKDGELYVYIDQTTNAGIPLPWKSFEIEITNQTNETCEFVAVVEYAEGISSESNNRYAFEAVNNNGWKLKSVVKNPVNN